jgi:tRNA-2-methylthio-N6-dimethylallyladenosine synthase
MNVRDSEQIADRLKARGHVETDFDCARLIIFNTCSVRHTAENKVFGKIGSLQRLRLQRPDMIVALGGCMAQIPENVAHLQKLKVDIIFGTHTIGALPDMIETYLEQKKSLVYVDSAAAETEEELMLAEKRDDGPAAFINIMYGCDNFCSYCIVPYTRGRERSRTPDVILEETRRAVSLGYKEVTFLGQNVNSYGKNLPDPADFSDLLAQADRIEGLRRIRFTTSHPKDLSEKLMRQIAASAKVCEYVHVALQSGSNRILKHMSRGYTREAFLDMAEKLRRIIPGVALGTDIIVGFPGETEADFADTVDLVKRVRFEQAFIFVYSPRIGTRAANYIDSVPSDIKKERVMALQATQYAIAKAINFSMIGRRVEVLVEGPSKTDPDYLCGRTRTNKVVVFPGDPDSVGCLTDVRIESANTFTLFGVPRDRTKGGADF